MSDAKKQFEKNAKVSQTENDEFLLREGFDLIAAFRAIKSEEARKSIIKMIAAIVQAENDARNDPYG